ncbi:MAG: hypothetical protein A3J10_00265 [Candidatus Sungbacteria bacterium RIFCSPLOWO2_02_FULL_54_10]|nr:MAG: hypothetical protein A3J10_00265 [Candidatus Sungbacteria bacterium RIFCSPLOWO2_02_FULL_54_10]
MLFGVFDGLHAGHRAFLASAKKRGRELIVVVARDAAVRLLKNKTPRLNEKARVRAIRASGLADRVVLGDKVQGTYGIIRWYQPDSVCLGYDQKALAADIRAHMRKQTISPVQIIRLGAHRPRIFKSSLRP